MYFVSAHDPRPVTRILPGRVSAQPDFGRSVFHPISTIGYDHSGFIYSRVGNLL
jgi:hypothetical protein